MAVLKCRLFVLPCFCLLLCIIPFSRLIAFVYLFLPYFYNHLILLFCYPFLNKVEMLEGADNMPGKWQLLIYLGQKTIAHLQTQQVTA